MRAVLSERPRKHFLLALAIVCAAGCAHDPPRSQQPTSLDPATVRRELQQRYDENNRAFLAKDLNAIMALRTEDFHAVTPDSVVHDRDEMERATRGLLQGIDRWISINFDIDSLGVEGDLAHAMVRQHVIRIASRNDGKVHHVETWVTQRETWRRTTQGWKLYRVDSIHDQRRLIDGQPG